MKNEVTTSRLLLLIRNADSFEAGMEYFSQSKEPTFHEELHRLLKEKRKTAKVLIELSGIERSYFYHILGGKKKPGRNMIIRIAACLRVSLDETNRLLRLGGYSPLYAKIHRDAIIIFGISKKMTMFEINELLLDAQQEPLFMEEQDDWA
ncbi:MAG: helix-turn-helix transcriptional regulator [Clostridia bacterium]|nr:helix-turn-helix transcriptional regulator [Clostridia bacterium]